MATGLPPHRRQASEASSTSSTVPPTPLALPHCGSLATMDVPWSPASAVRDAAPEDDDFDVDEDPVDADDDDLDGDDDDELGEFVSYGDRLCLLCDGQLLALTRKFNLSYQQMALLATATLLSGGLMGVASFFIWRKGLFRKRYAALLSDLIYRDGGVEPHRANEADDELHRFKLEQLLASHDDNDEPALLARESSSSKTLKKTAEAVAFRIFEYDPATRSINYASLGQPVRFDAPVVVAHAASRRVIRYMPHHGAVTISRPPRNPHFRKDVKENVAQIDALMKQHQMHRKDSVAAHKQQSRPRPRSLTSILQNVLGGGDRTRHSTDATRLSSMRSRSARDFELASLRRTVPAAPTSLGLLRSTTWSDPTTNNEAPRRRASQPPHFRPFGSTQQQQPPSSQSKKSVARSISESYVSLVRNVNDAVQEQKERRALKKRRKLLLKDLPNMAFPEQDGQYFVARLQPPLAPLFRSESSGKPKVPPQFLRWGAPMQIVADYNGSPCGFLSREYYRDAQQYMTSESTSCSPATIIPIPESGNLQAIAKESMRLVANIEKRQVKLRIGTYNVWMMPRKISMFASVSPKKNTRAKLIADVLPPCDVWVFTECFDHRARSVLLDKLKRAGGYYFNSPTVGHKRRGPDGRYLDKMINGGVVLASKYPILAVRIKLFREVSAGSDRFADKGVLYCKILKDGLLVHIFSTHLQAWNDDLSRTARRQQLEIIAEFMESMGIDERVDCVVYVGDLNVNMWLNNENGEYDEMLEILDAHDSSQRQLHAPEESAVLAAPLNLKQNLQYSFDGRLNPLASDGPSSDGSLELLDYVLYSKSHRQPSRATSYVQPLFATTPWIWKKQPQYHLSDHFPVISELTFDMWRE